ncbi:MAG TPA: YetF domain-containing protein [Pseudonocardiaceae bacterium]|nr:YetF domain-containing protein [Pseudonocardiaceae bacterium]
MWADLFHIQIPVLEKVLRTVLVYAGLAILLRLAGKRDLAQLNTFDLVVMLLLSNVVQNSIIGNDNSLVGGLLGALVLLAVNAVVVRVSNRHPRLTKIFEGTPSDLVIDGKPVGNLRRLGLRRADVTVALRHQGAGDITEVRRATLEPGGSIVVDLKEQAQDATVGDLDRSHAALLAELRAEIARLSARVDAGFSELAAK